MKNSYGCSLMQFRGSISQRIREKSKGETWEALMVSEGVRELLWSHLKGNDREMTVGGDEGEIKYPLSQTVTLSADYRPYRAALPPSPNSKE
jgi:hypothetical protein